MLKEVLGEEDMGQLYFTNGSDLFETYEILNDKQQTLKKFLLIFRNQNMT